MARRSRPLLFGALIVVGLAPPAAAQPADPGDGRLHTAVSVGYSKAWDDEGEIGTGAEVGGSAGWLATDHLELQASLSTLSHDRPTPFLSWDGRVWMLSVRAAYAPRARGARVWPFVAAGAGLMRSSGTITERRSADPFSPGPPAIVDVREWRYTGPMWEAGGGAEVRFGRAFVRPEAWWTAGMLDRGERAGIPEPPIIVTRVLVSGGVRF